ncbi:MAG: hypothetical protein FWB71_06760 [Defluviitaleaceae bacterium]|nr:hypothetical protein [Defluviitaleaceae bacterium]
MANAIFYCEYKLKKDAAAADFLAVSKRLDEGHISKQPGYISWQQLQDGDIWVDLLTFDTMENLKQFESQEPGELALSFYSHINMPSCKVRYYTIRR